MSTLSFSITGLDRTDYMVKDLRRAIAFYRDALGLELLNTSDDGAEFELPDGAIFGLWVGGSAVPFQPGNGVMFGVNDFKAAVSSVKSQGLHVTAELETPRCFIATVSDPEGNTVNLHKRKGPEV